MMSERIQELINQATDDILGVKVLDKRMFAELIVKECAEVAANVVAEHEGVDFGLVEKCYEHFGVEQ
jgi:hypothetical protein